MRSDSQTFISITFLVPSIHLLILLSTSVSAQEATMEPRWGHAATYIPSPPAILIQGGKTDPSSSFTYTSSPNSPDTFIIPLDQPFDGSPPIRQLDSTSPPHAFHTITNLGGSAPYDLLVFGGDGGPTTPTQTQADSAWNGRYDPGNNTVSWTHEANGWASQPQRRLYHSAAGPGDGKVYITGGLKGDGSGATFADVYAYDIASQTFTTLPPLSQGTYHHNSVLLPNGTLIVLGGVSTSPVTGNPATVPLNQVYTLDTTSSSPAWQTRSIGGEDPAGRRGSSSVLNADGSKAFLFGGSDARLTAPLGDGWELDMASSSWKQISAEGTGPAARFDHTAVGIGGDQVIVIGGYGAGGPVDPGVHVFDAATGTWSTSFTPPSPPSNPPEESSQTVSGPAAYESVTNDDPKATEGVTAGTRTGGSAIVGTRSDDPTNPSASASSSAPIDQAEVGMFTTPVKVALILGILAIVGIIIGGLLYRHRRKKRKAALLGAAAWNGRDGPDRPYGSREKGGEGLMDESHGRPSEPPERSPIIGLGMGAIGASLASISSKLGGAKRNQDPYAVLLDEGPSAGGPMRRSTRREGSGIRLVGPRPSPSKYTPMGFGAAAGRSSLDPVRKSRMDMLHDEDSRHFMSSEKSSDWAISSPVDKGRWSSARSILGHEHNESDPFDDDEGDDLSPPIRGGPVPTPFASRSDLDPFDDYNRRSSTFLSTFDDLLSPPVALYSDGGSLPRSQRSGVSGELSDMEEGSIHHAQHASQTSASILSPVETAYVPIKRSESFFKRMTQGGFTSLLSRQQSQKGTVRVLDIRDPTPAPELWPIESRDELSAPAGPSYPPSAFKGGLAPVVTHGRGPSLSSLQSAKSMRDMVIVQREPTSSSEEEGIISTAPSPEPEEYGEGSGHVRHGLTAASDSLTTVYAHERHGQTAISDSTPSISPSPLAGSDTSGSIVFNGADFASTPDPSLDMPGGATIVTPKTTPRKISTPPTLRETLRPVSETPPPINTAVPTLITPTRPFEPPSGSPVPSPLVSHRRPVRDFVNSINKRGGGLPLAFASPASAYSPTTTAPPSPLSRRGTERDGEGRKRPMTMYEAVKRERLLVANPDKRKEMNRTNSS